MKKGLLLLGGALALAWLANQIKTGIQTTVTNRTAELNKIG